MEIVRIEEGVSGTKCPVRQPKQGLSGVSLDPEVCRNIGVVLMERAYLLAGEGKPIPSGLLWTTLRNLLSSQIRFYTAEKRAVHVDGQNVEVGYDDVPGMNNVVYSGEEEL